MSILSDLGLTSGVFNSTFVAFISFIMSILAMYKWCHGCAMVKLHGLLSLSLGDGHQSTFRRSIPSIPCKDFHRMDDRQQYTHTC